jgi:hypothetical protein
VGKEQKLAMEEKGLRMERPDDSETSHITDAELSAHHAFCELHYGRVAWLAEHIRRSNFQISPMVARKLLALIEGGEANLFFELKLQRRSDLTPGFKDRQLVLFRDIHMAYAVGKLSGGFQRGRTKAAYHEVAEQYGLKESYGGSGALEADQARNRARPRPRLPKRRHHTSPPLEPRGKPPPFFVHWPLISLAIVHQQTHCSDELKVGLLCERHVPNVRRWISRIGRGNLWKVVGCGRVAFGRPLSLAQRWKVLVCRLPAIN